MINLILGFFDKLLESLFMDSVKGKIANYLDRRNVERIISRASEIPAQALEAYFHNENIKEQKVELLLIELQNIILSAQIGAKLLASASLDPEKLTDIILSEFSMPQGVEEEGMQWQFRMALQIVCDTLCNIGPRFANWEKEAWSRNFDAFDKLLENQQTIIKAVGPGGEGTLDERFEHTFKSHVLRKLAQIDASTFRVSSSLFLDLTTVFVEPYVIAVNKPSETNSPEEHEIMITLEEARKQILSEDRATQDTQRTLAQTFFAEHKFCAVVGLPGSGKTTLLQHMLLTLAKGDIVLNDCEVAIPVFVKVRQLNFDNLPNVDELLEVAEGKVFAGARPGFLKRQFEKGNVILLLDGLDEAPSEKRKLLNNWISDLIDLYPNSHYIVASRPAGYQSSFFNKLGFNEVSLCEFDDNQIQQYVSKWSKAVAFAEGATQEEAEKISQQNANLLTQKAKKNPYVRRIATNPLMLSTLCLVQRYEGGELPNRRVVLYQRCVEGLLFHWDKKRGISSALIETIPLERKMLLLRRLALEMQIREKAEIDENDIRTSFANSLIEVGELADVEAIIENIKDRSGLLVERRPMVYGFSHLTFQEYLAALSINQGDFRNADRLFLFGKRKNYQWREVIALYAGIAPKDSVESLIRELLTTNDAVLMPLCGECLVASQDAKIDLQKEVINRLLNLTDDIDSAGRWGFLAIQHILESLDESIVYNCVFENLKNLDIVHPTRYLYFRRSKVAIKALTEAGTRILNKKQKPAKWDYGISLILLLTEDLGAIDGLNELAVIAQRKRLTKKQGRVLCGLFSYELWGDFQKNRFPGVLKFLSTEQEIDVVESLCKYILEATKATNLFLSNPSGAENVRRDFGFAMQIPVEFVQFLTDVVRSYDIKANSVLIESVNELRKTQKALHAAGLSPKKLIRKKPQRE
jgi:hypothetical protein